MKVAILVGGKGLRLRGDAPSGPKALVDVGGRPILWHIMCLYAHWGFREFVLCLGHQGEEIVRAFSADPLQAEAADWDITFADTGRDTPTGGRLKRAEPHLTGDMFLATYGDGVADIDLLRLVAFHEQHGRVATVTAVRHRSHYGLMQVAEDGTVRAFREKPYLPEPINGGFYVLRREFMDELHSDDGLEQDALPRLVARGELVAYRHQGFWASLDTYKDALALNELWEAGRAPWKLWPDWAEPRTGNG